MATIEKKDIEGDPKKKLNSSEKKNSSEKPKLSKFERELLELKTGIMSSEEKKWADQEIDKFVNNWPSWPKKEKTQEEKKEARANIHNVIQKLKRPEEVKKEIEIAYTTTDNDIKNSPYDGNPIARVFWTIADKIINS